MGFYLGYLEVALLMQKTSGLSGGVVVVERDLTCEWLTADWADSALGVVEELANVFFGLVVHSTSHFFNLLFPIRNQSGAECFGNIDVLRLELLYELGGFVVQGYCKQLCHFNLPLSFRLALRK